MSGQSESFINGFILACGIAYTLYCFATHESALWCLANVLLDIVCSYFYFKKGLSQEN